MGIEPEFECDICGGWFKTLSGLKTHKINCKGEDKEFSCSICGYSVDDKSAFLSHLNNIHKKHINKIKNDYQKCDICGYITRTWDGMRFHIGNKHPEKINFEKECESCGEIFYVVESRIDCEKTCDKDDCVSEDNKSEDLYISFGPNWDDQRERAIKRDNEECVRCGTSRAQNKKLYGCDLSVDHIIKRKEFLNENGDLNYEVANKLENLQTLCSKHHKMVEARKRNEKVICIDPSLRETGYIIADVRKRDIIDSGCIKTRTDDSFDSKNRDRIRRTQLIINRFMELYDEYKYDKIISELPYGSQSASASWSMGAMAGIVASLSPIYGLVDFWYTKTDCHNKLFGETLDKEETVRKMKEKYENCWYEYKYQNQAVADSIVVFERYLKFKN